MGGRHAEIAAAASTVLAVCALLLISTSPRSSVAERLQVVYRRNSDVLAEFPLQMLVCDPDAPHCGYGGVDTSQEAYDNPNPLAIINEQCTAENR